MGWGGAEGGDGRVDERAGYASYHFGRWVGGKEGRTREDSIL